MICTSSAMPAGTWSRTARSTRSSCIGRLRAASRITLTITTRSGSGDRRAGGCHSSGVTPLASTEISVPGRSTRPSPWAAAVLTAVQAIGQDRQPSAASEPRKIGVA